jgi:hypothetical protein
MGIQLAALERLKEQAFAQDILAFAADKYNAEMDYYFGKRGLATSSIMH